MGTLPTITPVTAVISPSRLQGANYEVCGGQSPPVTGDHTITLPPALQAPAHARAWVAERAGPVARAVLDDALLVVSELVTNAIRHGRPDIVLSLRQLPNGLRVAVGDGGPAMPVPTASPALDRPNGRGLLIVAATAQNWGINRHHPGPGKTVWAELIAH